MCPDQGGLLVLKRVGLWITSLLGVLALVAGTVVAAAVGPDDVVSLPAHEVKGSPTTLVTSPALLAYTGTTLRVTAGAARGVVFVGAAHPVDVASYVGKAPHLVVDQIGASGEVSGHLDGSKGMPAEPAGLAMWTHEVTGDRSATLDVPLDGATTQVVVRYEAAADPTLGLGASIPGLFRLAVLVASAGLLLIVLLLVLRRRRRPRRAPGALPGESQEDRAEIDSTGLGDVPGARPEQLAGTSQRRTNRLCVSGLGVATSLALSGCIALPSAVPAPKGPPTKVALTVAESKSALVDYDKRNNAAIAALTKRFDLKVWDNADAGPTLALDRAQTALAHMRKKKETGSVLEHRPGLVYSPEFTACPMWAAMTLTVAEVAAPDKPGSGKKDSDKQGSDKPHQAKRLAVFSRTSASKPWRLFQNVSVDVTPSKPRADGETTARKADIKAAVAVMKDVTRWLEGGRTTVKVSESMRRLRDDVRSTLPGSAGTVVSCSPYLVDERPEDSLRVVRTERGALTVMTLQCQRTITAEDGILISWPKEYSATLGLTSGESSLLTQFMLVTVAVETRGSGRVGIGASASVVRTSDRTLS